MNFWKYKLINHKPVEIYCIYGEEFQRHAAVKHMKEKYKMSDVKAYAYINSLPHF